MAKDPARQTPTSPADAPQGPSDLPPPVDPSATVSPFASDATDLFFNSEPHLSDDTPTVISRMPPRPASSEEVWNGSLRGRKLAHFELIEPVGVGGMAAVLRARDLQLDRMVALKILPPEMAHDPESVQRFHNEARAAAKLDHENIARVYFCGEDQKLHFIAFEFVEGETLRSLVEKRGSLPVTEALHYMLQVATGLAHAASRGVIHRDIKPSNIIISPNGRAKLVDMGLARSLGPQVDGGLTQSGVTLGTFDYISPEQALEPRDADIRSDVYSLGCTFYHVLTGQPSVPEGTAAKKLHHHQHVAPLDPRQLNPDIPDEVAAILGRMMAKDPRQRYQKAEHLVQHLLAAAHKLGAAPDLPDGVLFVDAPLPTPPRPRPLLLTVVAVLALIALVVFLGQGPRPPWASTEKQVSGTTWPLDTRPNPPQPSGDKGQPQKGSNPQSLPKDTPAETRLAVYDDDSPQVAKIAEFLNQNQNRMVEVRLAGNLDLTSATGTNDAALTFQGDQLLIQPRVNRERSTLKLNYDAYGQKPRIGLVVKKGKVILRNLRIEVDASQTPDVVLAGLVREGGEIVVENCLFVQKRPPQGLGSLSSVKVSGQALPNGQPAVTLKGCCFLLDQEAGDLPSTPRAGQHALSVTSSALVTMTQCAFGPHAAVVAFQGNDLERLNQARVEMTHCTALLTGDTSICRLDRTSRCFVTATNCLFSRAEMDPVEEAAETAVLVRQMQEGPVVLSFLGKDNRYHNLTAFWTSPAFRPLAQTDAEFREAIKQYTGKDEDSSVVADWPWTSRHPLQDLKTADETALRQAFRVKTSLAQMRKSTDSAHLIGVEYGIWGDPSYTINLPDLAEMTPAAARGTKIVRPGNSDSARDVYPTLGQALAAAQNGDVILIETSEAVPVASLRLPRQAELTIRAATGHHPTLTLATDAEVDEHAFLFRLSEGKLRLEGLDIVLQPGKLDMRTLAVVSAIGDGECAFKDCILTLDSGNAPVSLAAVGLTKGMRGDRPADRQLRLSFTNCLVRGHGDLISGSPGRAFDVQGDNVLIALTGSFLRLSGTGDDAQAPQPVEVQLRRVTTYLGGHMLNLTADKETGSLLPIHVRPVDDCLFISADGKVLIHLDGPDLSSDRMRELLVWAGNHNAYNKFMDMLDQMPIEKMGMRLPPLDKERWRQFARDTGLFDRVKLSDFPNRDGLPRDEFPRVSPNLFKTARTDPDQPPYGADVEALQKLLRETR